MCLLNPHCFDPCIEGEGILLIDQIDHQLDQNNCAEILQRLHQAFPRLQIIASGNRDELLEHAVDYQCLRLDAKEIYEINVEKSQQQLSQLYNELVWTEGNNIAQTHNLLETETLISRVDELFHQIQELNPQEKNDLLSLLKIDDTPEETPL